MLVFIRDAGGGGDSGRLTVAGVDLGARFSWQAVRRYEFGLDYLLAHEVERARVEARRRMRLILAVHRHLVEDRCVLDAALVELVRVVVGVAVVIVLDRVSPVRLSARRGLPLPHY